MSFSDHSEDMFSDTRMTFGDHLEELRTYLWRAIIGFVLAIFVSFFFGNWVLQLIAAPVEKQLGRFYDKRVEKVLAQLDEGYTGFDDINKPVDVELELSPNELLPLVPANQREQIQQALDGKPIKVHAKMVDPLRFAAKMQKAMRVVSRRPTLSTLSIQEALMAYFKVCVACGFVLGSPWIIWQLWQFVAAGLYPHEKRLVHVYLPASVGLFITGVVVCQTLVIPQAIAGLLWFNEWTGLEPDLRFNEWLGFAIWMPIAFGISFQLPLVMMFMERIGIFTIESYVRKWKWAFFLIHVLAFIVLPPVDVISMELFALPLFGLYVLGIFLCRLNPKKGLETDVPESEEMVEV